MDGEADGWGDLICFETKGSQHVNEVRQGLWVQPDDLSVLRRGVLRLMRITCQGSD
ncbi:MAG: hypothetical protein MUO38_14945 [Anaerolineales bacterium]|nr:hypothetical protein [Anaerolineales bacterium]